MVAEPGRADELLPIFRVALRSVREAERRVALAEVARAAFEAPELEAKIQLKRDGKPLGRPLVTISGSSGWRGSTSVSGPGQNSAISLLTDLWRVGLP